MRNGSNPSLKAVLFDYGGVLAEEGFRDGLMALGLATDLGPDEFFRLAADAVYDSGYVLGKARESAYWDMVRERTGVHASDEQMRAEILERFVLRPWMFPIVQGLRDSGYLVAILSDQTQWLDELDRRDDFLERFDKVFNSYYLGKGKRDATVFRDVAEALDIEPRRILFVDDNPGHVERAVSEGLQTILYQNREDFLEKMDSAGLGDIVRRFR